MRDERRLRQFGPADFDGGYILRATRTPMAQVTLTSGWSRRRVRNKTWDKTFGGRARRRQFGPADDRRRVHHYGLHVLQWCRCTDVWLVKTDASGNKTWDKTFAGRAATPAIRSSRLRRRYIITGTTSSYGADNADVWLVKTDASGNKTWTRLCGTNYDMGTSVQQTTDGGTSSQATPNPMVQVALTPGWSRLTRPATRLDKTFGVTNYDVFTSVQQTTDGGYIIRATRTPMAQVALTSGCQD